MKKNNILFCVLISFGLVVSASCSDHASKRNKDDLDTNAISVIHVNQTNWNPDTANLDQVALGSPHLETLKQNIKLFYELLHKRDWEAAYELRSKEYKDDFPKSLYLSLAQEEGKNWCLLDYSVLSVKIYDSNHAAVICNFIELPGPVTSFSTVEWHKETDEVWRCNAAGPDKLSIFIGTRAKY